MKIKNTDFGTYMAPLMRPIYVMQMARSKEWSATARLDAIGRLRAACVEVINLIDQRMQTLCDEATQAVEERMSPRKPTVDQKADDLMASRLEQGIYMG